MPFPSFPTSSVSSYPIDDNTTQAVIPRCSVPFSAAEFFRDTPWLNVPQHRRADIIVEPLYPRLSLLGGAPPQEGKMSKLAALAAARKKKNSEKPSGTKEEEKELQPESSREQRQEKQPAPRSLSERLAVNRAPGRAGGLSSIASRESRLSGRATNLKGTTTVVSETGRNEVNEPPVGNVKSEKEVEDLRPGDITDLRAIPSTFAATIVGNGINSTISERSHLPLLGSGSTFDVMHTIYQQDMTEEAFDFAGPSPDDVVLNAQSASKGLPIRGTR